MGSSSEKFQLIFEARDAASAKIRQLNRELARLGGPKMVKSQREIKKLERSIQSLGKAAPKAGMHIGKMAISMAKGMLMAQGVMFAFSAVAGAIGEIGKAIVVAGNVEELGKVLKFVGQNAGYTSEQLDGYVISLRRSGITQVESNKSLLRAIQGNIKLTDAIKLGRIAQDAAVIGQTNSSDAFNTLINAVVKGRVVLLKSLGIQGTFQREYSKLAKTLGKTQVALTEAEKQQARLNLVMRGGEIIAGAYETSMESASKRMRSLVRHVQNAQIAVGNLFREEFRVAVDAAESLTKAIVTVADTIRSIKDVVMEVLSPTDLIAKATEEVTDRYRTWNIELDNLIILLDSGKISIENFRNELSRIGQDRITPFTKEDFDWINLTGEGLGKVADATNTLTVAGESFLRLQLRTTEAAKNLNSRISEAKIQANTIARINQRISKKIGSDLENFKIKIDLDFDLDLGLDPIVDEVDFSAINKGLAVANKIRYDMADEAGKLEIRQRIEFDSLLTALAEDKFGIDELTAEERLSAMADLQATHLEELAGLDDTYIQSKEQKWAASFANMSAPARAFLSNIEWSMQSAVGNMINDLNFLQTSSNGVFKNMASDFIQLFIKTAMMQLALKFVGNIAGGGILGVLSSLFDTPKNDRMAAGEGRSFMSWFTKGMLAEAQGGSEMAVGITNSSRSIAPVTGGGGGGGGGGMVVLNVSVSGNVLSSDYVEQTIAPQLEKLINDGRSLLSVQSENQTGGRDVVIN